MVLNRVSNQTCDHRHSQKCHFDTAPGLMYSAIEITIIKGKCRVFEQRDANKRGSFQHEYPTERLDLLNGNNLVFLVRFIQIRSIGQKCFKTPQTTLSYLESPTGLIIRPAN
ncbi:unnamed protein product, partial [Brenthis ino]